MKDMHKLQSLCRIVLVKPQAHVHYLKAGVYADKKTGSGWGFSIM